MLTRLKAHDVKVLLVGMYAPRNLGSDYGREFDAVFPRLAKQHGVPLYPFFLDGVAGDPALSQEDGLHPNARGVDVIVERIGPSVLKLINGAPPS
jgi:acyl-CoA thioesterase-1